MPDELSNDATVVSGRIIIVIDLPQPIDKITKVLSALGTAWPKSVVNAKPQVRSVSTLGGSLCHIAAE